MPAIAVAVVLGIATLIGAAAAIQQLWQQYSKRTPRRLGWRKVEEGVLRVIKRLREDNYVPDVIIAIGRSGAIFGGLLAGNMNNLPLALLDRKLAWDKDSRKFVQSEFSDVHIGPACHRVLVVVGEVYSGQSLDECLRSLAPFLEGREVRTCALVKSRTATRKVDYYIYEVDRMVMPAWVITSNYRRVAEQSVDHQAEPSTTPVERSNQRS